MRRVGTLLIVGMTLLCGRCKGWVALPAATAVGKQPGLPCFPVVSLLWQEPFWPTGRTSPPVANPVGPALSLAMRLASHTLVQLVGLSSPAASRSLQVHSHCLLLVPPCFFCTEAVEAPGLWVVSKSAAIPHVLLVLRCFAQWLGCQPSQVLQVFW